MVTGERPQVSVVEAPRPRFSPEDAAVIAAETFGIVGEASWLPSERDQAFLIDDGAGGGGVLKISNAAERLEVIGMEAAAVLHVLKVDPGLPVARPVARVDAVAEGLERFRSEVAGDEGPHIVRCFERLPGRAGVSGAELDPPALRDFGRTVARLGRALRAFRHEVAFRPLLWDLQHVLGLRAWVNQIADPGRRALVARTLDRFERRVSPRWAELRAQVIHGDVTLDNTLLDERLRISGLVDFGDMSHTALVVDVSSALESVLRGRDEVWPAARSLVDGYEELTPLEPLELELLADLTAARTAMTLTITNHQRVRDPSRSEYLDDEGAEGYWALLERLDEVEPDRAAAELGAEVLVDRGALLERRGRVLGSALTAPSYDPPLYLVRGEGTYVFDEEGRRYLDAYNNVPVVGHEHPRVTGAVARQTRRLVTNMRYLHHAIVELAERLVATMPAGSGLDTVLFVNSGSEANDLAWRIARAATGGTGGIVTEHAYHGITDAIAALSPEEWRGEPPSHVVTIPPPDPRRVTATDWPSTVSAAAERLAERGIRPAVVMIDAAFTSDGIFAPEPDAMRELVQRTHKAGALYVADEVQIGHGRTGEALWSFVADQIDPDVVTLGKPMGNGFPVAAVVTRAELVDRFAQTTEFFSTFAGSPAAAAAALAVLDVIRDEGLVERARDVGEYLGAHLEERARSDARIVQVRRRGLLIGAELSDPARVSRVLDRMRDRGVLIGSTGRAGDVLKIRPPLSATLEEVAPIVPALAEAIAEG
jgi:4-aminobutyrate aminotransferase-like enzyme/Ser/Thr protein kinase RdoA (MazF antagonist)